MACPPPFAAVETRFLKALEQTTSFRIEGATLELRNGTTVLASFKANR
jgi:heat shock protein HslJ